MNTITLANQFAIPGTGVRRSTHWFRRPRHAGVLRGLSAFGTLRGQAVPPSDWDDLLIGGRMSRSWKRHRARQWRETEPEIFFRRQAE